MALFLSFFIGERCKQSRHLLFLHVFDETQDFRLLMPSRSLIFGIRRMGFDEYKDEREEKEGGLYTHKRISVISD
jgi:hypothetical protein